MASDSPRPITVLLVEDHEVTLHGLHAALSKEEGIEVVGMASNSDDGLRLAKEAKPQVVLLDLHLPGSMGPRSMVKSFCDLKSMRVIIFSVENRPAYVETILELGPAGYLLKSESLSMVAQAIRKVAGGGSAKVLSQQLEPVAAKLTQTEHELLKMLARGMKYQTIAERRHTSPETIRKQCDTLMLKLRLDNREELISWAATNGYAALEL